MISALLGTSGGHVEWDEEFSRFVRDYSDALYRTAYVLEGEAAAAADLVQETLTRLYPKWTKVLAADLPLAYVRRSLVNQHISAGRGARIHPLLFADVPQVPSGGTRLDPGSAWGRPEMDVLERDDVTRRLAAVSARQRAALILRYLHDLDDHDGAAQLGCPESTFRSLIRRGLNALRAAESSRSASVAARTEGVS